MNALKLGLLAVSLILATGVGCYDIVPPPPPFTNLSEDLGHPDSLINDLQVSYRRREINPYANLLAPEFIFVFQEDDAVGLPVGFWNKDEDSTGTASLFDAVQVVDIRITLNWFDPEPAVTTALEDAQRVAVITNLDVDIDGGATTLRVPGDQQHFYFRPGKEDRGEDPNRWFLSEWRDLGNAGGAGAPRVAAREPLADGEGNRRIILVTMSELRRRLGL